MMEKLFGGRFLKFKNKIKLEEKKKSVFVYGSKFKIIDKLWFNFYS